MVSRSKSILSQKVEHLGEERGDIGGKFHHFVSAKRKCAGSHYSAPALIILFHSVSPTKLPSTSPENITRGYDQLLRFTLEAVCQKDHCKSTSRKAAQRILVKLTPHSLL